MRRRLGMNRFVYILTRSTLQVTKASVVFVFVALFISLTTTKLWTSANYLAYTNSAECQYLPLRHHELNQSKTGPIRIIWSYWDSAAAPKQVRAVVEQWKILNPRYEVRFLSPGTVKACLGRDFTEYKRKETRSDVIRLKLLERYGGVWLDASVVLLESLDAFIPWETLHGDSIFGFYNSKLSSMGEKDVLESWLLASYPNSKCVQLLLRTLESTLQTYRHSTTGTAASSIFIPEARAWHKIVSRTLSGDSVQWGEYLLIYTAYTFLYHRDKVFRAYLQPALLPDATHFGYKVQYEFNWNMSKVNAVLTSHYMKHPLHTDLLRSKLIKVSTKGETVLETLLEKSNSNDVFLTHVLGINRQPTFQRSEVNVVVARFNENVTWLVPYSGLCTFLNKGPFDASFPHANGAHDPVVQLANVGRESHSFIAYIVQNYFALSDYTVFVQAGLDPAHSWIRKDYGGLNMIQNMLEEAKTSDNGCSKALAVSVNGDDWGFDFDGRKIRTSKYKAFETSANSPSNLREFFKHTLNMRQPRKGKYKVYPSAFMAIRKERILSNPRAFYIKILDSLSYSSDPIEGHFMERSWYHIFSCK